MPGLMRIEAKSVFESLERSGQQQAEGLGSHLLCGVDSASFGLVLP